MVDLQPTQSNRVNGKRSHDQPNVRVEPDGAGYWLSGSKPTGDFGSKSQQDRNQNPNNKNTRSID